MAMKPRVLSLDEDANEATVYIYDAIDSFWGLRAEDVVRQIDGLDVARINLRINSPGGDVFDGLSIYNALKAHPAPVHAKVDGMAASIASVIMLAADETEMAEGSFVMVHNPWMVAFGDVEELSKSLRLLEKLTDDAVAIYARRTGNSETQMREWMSAETWFNAEEAVEAGFATKIEGEAQPVASRVAARFDWSSFRKMPERAAAMVKEAGAPAITTIREFEEFLRDEGNFSRAAAKAIASHGFRAADSDPPAEDEALLTRLFAARLALSSRNLQPRK